MENSIVNKVSNSPLEIVDLQDYKSSGVRNLVDMFREYYVNILQAEIDARKTAAGKQKYKDMMKTNVRYIDRKGETSPPFKGINLKSGDKMRNDWFPVVWSS